MKIKVQITELTHEDLVNLLSTTLYESPIFVGRLLDDWSILESKGEEKECFEDKMANVLLYGGEVAIFDIEADGEKYVNKGVSSLLKDTGYVEYHFDLKAVKNGLKMALESKEDYIRLAAFNFLINDGTFDATDAEVLMQMILFGEVIYG